MYAITEFCKDHRIVHRGYASSYIQATTVETLRLLLGEDTTAPAAKLRHGTSPPCPLLPPLQAVGLPSTSLCHPHQAGHPSSCYCLPTKVLCRCVCLAEPGSHTSPNSKHCRGMWASGLYFGKVRLIIQAVIQRERAPMCEEITKYDKWLL